MSGAHAIREPAKLNTLHLRVPSPFDDSLTIQIFSAMGDITPDVPLRRPNNVKMSIDGQRNNKG